MHHIIITGLRKCILFIFCSAEFPNNERAKQVCCFVYKEYEASIKEFQTKFINPQ